MLLRSQAIVQKFENLSKMIGIDGRVWLIAKSLKIFCPQLSIAKEDVTQNFVIVNEIN